MRRSSPPLRHAVLAAIALFAAACGSDSPSLLGPDELRTIAAAHAKWKASGIDAYVFEVRTLCFCPPDWAEWTELEVRDGAVVAMRVPGGAELARSQWGDRKSVEQLFELAWTFRPDWARDANVEFDPQLGYPTVVDYDSRREILDAGITYQARNLRAIP